MGVDCAARRLRDNSSWYEDAHALISDNLTLNEFESRLSGVPWFRHAGQPANDSTASFIRSWDDWPGPEDERVSAIHFRQQALHDEILAANPSRSGELEELFQRVTAQVVALASQALSVNPNQQDSWDAPSTAVWHAGYTSGLIALCLATTREIPADIQAQWNWFSRGRWPSALASADSEFFTFIKNPSTL